MRIMIDSNVIVSAVYNPKSKPATALGHVCENHDFVLCDHIIAECYDVINRKFPQHLSYLDKLFISLGYELVTTPRTGMVMTDPKDSPILNAAILANIDIVISGDRHFLSLDIETPEILAPAQYLEKYGSE